MRAEYRGVEIRQKPIARAGEVRIQITKGDVEKEDPLLNEVAHAIEGQLEAVTKHTENDFQRRRAITSTICWLVIFLLVGNYFFHWFF
mmetsp:Transcript_10344/g.29552  ORF Transcript_10344/g.29552 Transcript_10344/m.29552 type:complete len:88 (-) Transcript_10344:102-365(-)